MNSTSQIEPVGLICCYDVNGQPVYNDKRIVGKYFGFCRTAFRPYDLVVNCFLVIARIEKYPKKTVAMQDSWGAWWTYCPGCGRIRLELNPDRVPKACPVCNRKVEVTLPAHT
jgi:rubrerythrin